MPTFPEAVGPTIKFIAFLLNNNSPLKCSLKAGDCDILSLVKSTQEKLTFLNPMSSEERCITLEVVESAAEISVGGSTSVYQIQPFRTCGKSK